MRHIPRSYQWPVGLAVALHLVLLLALCFEMPKTATFGTHAPMVVPKIVQAVAVNQTQVDQQIQQIQKSRDEEKAAEAARLKRLKDQAAAAKRQRVAEERRLASLKAKQVAAKKQLVAHQKAVAAQKAKAQKAAKAKALAKKRAAEKAKRLAEAKAKKAKALAEAKKRKADQLALEQKKLQAEQMKAERQALSQAQTQQMQGLVDRYKGQILQAIQQQWILPDGANKNQTCVFLIHLGPGGVVISVKLVESSGDTVLDRSAKMAVFKASPLPVPKEPSLFNQFRELRLTVRPENIAG